MVQVSDIERAVRGCLDIIGVSANDCMSGVYDCRSIDVNGAGAYVFFDDSGVYYVGETNNMANRLQDHCNGKIGGSEGVVRFLMHHLEEICANSNEWAGLDAKGREEFVKNKVLKEKINNLKIYVVTCEKLRNEEQGNKRNKLRYKLEKCLKKKLRPILNP